VVGIDVFDAALAVAREDVAASEVADRIDVRDVSVRNLLESSTFALAWLPQPFIARSDVIVAVARTFDALVPGGWLVMPIAEAATHLRPDRCWCTTSAHAS
jgi:hypothetical protein